MPRMYCSKASSRMPLPAAAKVSSATLNDGSSCRVSFHANVLNTAIRSRISPRALTSGSHPQLRHVHQPRLGHNSGSVGRVTAHHNRIGVQRLRQFQRTRARRLKALRQTQVVQRIHPVFAAGGLKPCRGESACSKSPPPPRESTPGSAGRCGCQRAAPAARVRDWPRKLPDRRLRPPAHAHKWLKSQGKEPPSPRRQRAAAPDSNRNENSGSTSVKL